MQNMTVALPDTLAQRLITKYGSLKAVGELTKERLKAEMLNAELYPYLAEQQALSNEALAGDEATKRQELDALLET